MGKCYVILNTNNLNIIRLVLTNINKDKSDADSHEQNQGKQDN